MIDCSKCIHYPICDHSRDYFKLVECAYYLEEPISCVIRKEVIAILKWEYKGDLMSCVVLKEGEANE